MPLLLLRFINKTEFKSIESNIKMSKASFQQKWKKQKWFKSTFQGWLDKEVTYYSLDLLLVSSLFGPLSV